MPSGGLGCGKDSFVTGDTLTRARSETAPFALIGELTQVLNAMRTIAPLAGVPGDDARLLDALIEAISFDAGAAAVLRYERALRQAPGKCPSIEPFMSSLDDVLKPTARRRMLRLGVTSECSTCSDVLAAGMAADEGNSESVLTFATCAEGIGDLDLARRAIERAASMTTLQVEASPYHWAIAELRLARVLVKQNKLERARAMYTKFIERWNKADRIVPEIAAAKAELEALQVKRVK